MFFNWKWGATLKLKTNKIYYIFEGGGSPSSTPCSASSLYISFEFHLNNRSFFENQDHKCPLFKSIRDYAVTKQYPEKIFNRFEVLEQWDDSESALKVFKDNTLAVATGIAGKMQRKKKEWISSESLTITDCSREARFRGDMTTCRHDMTT